MYLAVNSLLICPYFLFIIHGKIRDQPQNREHGVQGMTF